MNKTISFFLGLLIGIMICVLLVYFDIKLYKNTCPECDEKEVVTHIKTDTVYVASPSKPAKLPTDLQPIEPLIEENVAEEQLENEAIYESEFFLDEIEQDEVFVDCLLQTKTLKVRVLPHGEQEEKLPDDFFQFFEIQQWSTPFRNKVTYYRDKNMVKVKGISIEQMNVVFWNDLYFLETGHRYYAIPETKDFEKLNLIQIPQ